MFNNTVAVDFEIFHVCNLYVYFSISRLFYLLRIKYIYRNLLQLLQVKICKINK